MDAVTLLKERRSVRRYKDVKVSKELMLEVLELANRAPSWGNFQIARYTIVQNEELIRRIGEEGVNEFVYNVKALKNAKNVCVLSYVAGKSGKFDTDEYVTSKSDWEVFDAGIASHQFTLSLRAKGLEAVTMGVINSEVIKDIINLPEGETVGALIVFGYDNEPTVKFTPRKSVEEIARFL